MRPFADVPPGRGPVGGRARQLRRPESVIADFPAELFRDRRHAGALRPSFFPFTEPFPRNDMS